MNQDPVVEKLLKQHGIIKYNGRLIVPDDNKVYYYVSGRKYNSINQAKSAIEKSKKR